VSPAVLSLLALGVVVAASFTTRLNVGIIGVALAGAIAIYAAGMPAETLGAAFPSSLFLTLLGVTLLFGVAQSNGTMAGLTARALRVSGGRVGLLPPIFFAVACAMSTMGPGAIPVVALLAPLAMAAGARAGIPVLLTALMVGNGANSGNLSPFSTVGIIVQTGMAKAGLTGHEWTAWAANFVAHLIAGAIAWGLFGGRRLLRERTRVVLESVEPFTSGQRTTLIIGLAWVIAVVVLKVNIGLASFAAAGLVVLFRAGEDAAMLKSVPWSVLVMVCGVSVLIGVLERTGGMELFTAMLAKLATPGTVNGMIAFVTGLISTYSSTAAVVYPTFLPTVPGLVTQLGGGDPLQIALSINVGAALVDVSPLSTLGALCIAALPKTEDPERLFRQLLTWGLSMTIVGAIISQFLVPLLAP
jgi:hypothetical protein